MKILIVNQHANNFGDEAAGTAVVNNLLKNKKIDCIEILYCMPGFLPVEDKRVIHNHELNVRNFRKRQFWQYVLTRKATGSFLPKFIKKICENDVVLVSPCGANLGIYQDWHLLMQDIVVALNKSPLIFHLNTISPSKSKFFDFLVIQMCKKAKVYVREKASYNYLHMNGVNAVLGTDSAFSLESKGKVTVHENRIVFVPSDLWKWHKDFLGKDSDIFDTCILEPLIDFARSYDMEICILPHLNTPEEEAFNDSIMKKAIQLIPDIKISILKTKSCYEYENYIRSSYMVVGMRYHSIIFSCKNCIPFVALSYEQKMIEVSQYSRQIDNCIDIMALNEPKQMTKKLEVVYNSHDRIVGELKARKNDIVKKSLIVIEENFDK